MRADSVSSPYRPVALRPLYTPEERARRDASRWTVVQGVLAAAQFVVFLVSLVLVVRCLLSGKGAAIANISVVMKTIVLYSIMVTGAIWEKEVFGQYLFAPSFFWEDVVSMAVIALHTIYVVLLLRGDSATHTLMVIALTAYSAYALNAGQFMWKLRRARLDASATRRTSVDAPRSDDY